MSENIEKIKRRRRFERDRSPPDFQVTEDDVEILKYIHTHRFLNTSLIVALDARSKRIVQNRLRHLFDHGYIDKPKKQREFYTDSGMGNREHIYALDNRGAKLLFERCGIHYGRLEWPRKNAEVKNLHIEHTLLVSQFMVKLELSCRERGNVRIITSNEVLFHSPVETQMAKDAFYWRVDFHHKGELIHRGIKPDKVFGLHFLDEPQGANKVYFFFEADRGTETSMGSNIAKSFFGKMVAYMETYYQKLHTRRYGIKHFRVLTLTTNQKRVSGFLENNKKIGNDQGSPLLLFTHMKTFEEYDNLLDLPWINGRGEVCRLSD
jgi:Replication-relaxation